MAAFLARSTIGLWFFLMWLIYLNTPGWFFVPFFIVSTITSMKMLEGARS